MRRSRQLLLIAIMFAAAQTAIAEEVTAYCEITNHFDVYTYRAVASALWGVGAWYPRCPTLPEHECDFHEDYLTAVVLIENTTVGTISEQFSGIIANPSNEGCFPLPCPPESTPTELDWSIDFDLPLPTFAACADGTLTVTGGNTYDQYSYAFSSAQGSCWQKTLCHLNISVSNGLLLPTAPQSGYYSCTDCVEYWTMPVSGKYCFQGWSGDLESSDPTDPTINVCFGGRDLSITAIFDECPPCDPWSDPTCSGGEPLPCDNCGPGNTNPPNSPIVINFGQGDYRLTGKNSPVFFDIAASGRLARIGWTQPNADEAFLCLDRNGNGTIDDGSELFGTATRLKNGARAQNGFVALAEYDSDGNGVIDERDAICPHLLLWRDLNHDGISQPSELIPAAASTLKSISLNNHWSGRRDAWGNLFRYQGAVRIANNHGNVMEQPLYDIFFVTVP